MYYNRKNIGTIFFLGIASGLPLALTSATLQAWYTVSGASLLAIGWLTVVGQPYAYKFLWAPFLDHWSPLRGAGRRRGWMLITQLLLVCALMMMACLRPDKTPWLLAFVALFVAVFSATFDTAFDAYRTELLTEEERGLGTSVYTIAYRFAMIISSAVALMMAAAIGWHAMYLTMAGIMAGLMIATWRAQNPAQHVGVPTTLREALVAPLKTFFSRKNALIIALFIVLYKLPDAMALSLSTTFLIRGMDFSLMQIGAISKSVGVIGLLLGSVIGGILMPRMGVYRALWVFGILQTASNLLYVWLACAGKNIIIMAITMFGENFCSGLSTIAFVVFLMNLCDQRYTATHYALFSAVASLGRIFIGPVAAMLITHIGWIQFYILATLIGIPTLVLLYRVQDIGAIPESA